MPALFVASEKGGILMKLTDELYESVKDIWEGYHSHPFIQEMRAGTLPIEKFRYYMIQDYIYLYEERSGTAAVFVFRDGRKYLK